MFQRAKHARAWLLVLLAISGVAWILWIKSDRPADFAQDYFAAQVLLDGGSVYGEDVVQRGRDYFGEASPANFHPPTLTVFLLPLSFLPFKVAFILLGAVTAGLYAWSLWAASRATLLGGGRARLLFFGLLWWPFWACLTHGQVSMVIAAALTAGWICDERRRSVAAGAWVGFAALLKLFPALVGLYFVLRRDLRALAAMGAVFVGGWVVAWGTVGTQDVLHYWTVAALESAAHWASNPLNVSLQGTLAVTFGKPAFGTQPLFEAPALATALRWLLTFALLALTIIRGVSLLRQGRRGARRVYCALCVLALFLSPLTWSHTLAALLLPLVVAFADREIGWTMVVAFLLIGLPGPPLGQLVGPLFEGDPIPWAVAIVFQAATIGLVLLWKRLMGLSSSLRNLNRSS